MIRRYALLTLLALGARQSAHAFWDDFDMDDLMIRPRRMMADVRKHFAKPELQSISNCAVSSNDQEVVISLNLLQPIDPAAIKSTLSGDVVTVQVRLGTQNYVLTIRAHAGKLSYACSAEREEHQEVARPEFKAKSESMASSIIQQSFPADIDLSAVSVELDGTMLHVHIPRKVATISQELPIRVKSKKIISGDK